MKKAEAAYLGACLDPVGVRETLHRNIRLIMEDLIGRARHEPPVYPIPESVETTASVHLGKDDKGPLITTIELDCKVKCDGLSQEKFEELAAAAKAGCPISRLVAAADIKLKAELL